MNLKKHDFLLELNDQQVNKYSFKNNQVNNFYKHGTEELGLNYQKDDNLHCFYFNQKKIGEAKGLLAGSTSRTAFRICRDKFKTEQLLESLNVPTLHSKIFYEHEKQQAIAYANNAKFKSFVLKPLSLAGGKGIELDISLNQFSNAWESSIKIQKEMNVKTPSCVVQPFVDGYDVRIAITEGYFSSALLRVPAHVVGDGNNNIRNLIMKKNEVRKESLYFKKFLYEFDEKLINKLSSQNLTLDTVPIKNQLVFISDLGNLTAGAESLDITDLVNKELIEIAIKATASIPGLYTAGVDILTEDFTSNIGYVSEMNTNANHQVHHLPYRGKVRKPFKDIVHGIFIKYKLQHGLMLTKDERNKLSQMQRFNEYRSENYGKIYRTFVE